MYYNLFLTTLPFLGSVIISLWIYGIYRRRQKKLINKILEKKIKELNETNFILQRVNLTNQTLISLLIHDVKAPMNFIKEIARTLDNNWEKTDDETRRAFLQSIVRSTTKIGNFITNYLSWVSHNESGSYPKSNFDLNNVVNNVILFHDENLILSSCNKTKIINNIPTNTLIYSNENCIEIILRNLVDNSIKYTESGDIIIYYQSYEDNFVIGCKDSGFGITQVDIDKILYTNQDNTLHTKDSFKLGYVFIKSLLKAIDGTLKISSKKNEGTDVKLIFKN